MPGSMLILTRVDFIFVIILHRAIEGKRGHDIFLVEETVVPEENQRPAASHSQTLSHKVVSRTSRRRTS
jgi:hypothetical protein